MACEQQTQISRTILIIWSVPSIFALWKLQKLLSCQPKVTKTSCFVYKVIRVLSLVYNSYPQDRMNTQEIYRFALAQAKCTR